MKKLIFSLLIIISSIPIFGQIAGNYQGRLVHISNSQRESSISLQESGSTITGQLTSLFNGVTDTYALKGKIENGIYVGTLTYKDGSIFNFRMARAEGNVIAIVILFQGNIILSGEYKKIGNADIGNANRKNSNTVPAPKQLSKNNDGLARDPNLIGRWYQVKSRTLGGVNSDTYLTFYPDGTIKEMTRISAISYGGSVDASVIGDFEPNEELEKQMNAGYRWFSKDSKICFRTADGKLDRTANYNFDGGNLFVRWDPNTKKAAYRRSN